MLSRSDDADYFPRAIQILVSGDNVNFTVVHVETDFTADPGTWYWFDITPAASGRHVRILATQANQSPEGLFFVQIAEIEIYPAVTTAPPTSDNAIAVS